MIHSSEALKRIDIENSIHYSTAFAPDMCEHRTTAFARSGTLTSHGDGSLS